MEELLVQPKAEVDFDPEHDEDAISLYHIEQYEEISEGDSIVLNEKGVHDAGWIVTGKDDSHYSLSLKKKTPDGVEEVKQGVHMKDVVNYKHDHKIAA